MYSHTSRACGSYVSCEICKEAVQCFCIGFNHANVTFGCNYNLPLINEAVFYSLESYEHMCMKCVWRRSGGGEVVTTLEAKSDRPALWTGLYLYCII